MNLIGLLVVILLMGVLAVVVLSRTAAPDCSIGTSTTTIVVGVTSPRLPGAC